MTKYTVAADPKVVAARSADSVIALGALRFKGEPTAPALVYREMGDRVLFRQGSLPSEMDPQSQRRGHSPER